jgi:hypothetical protein
LGLVGDVGFTTAIIGKAPVEALLQNAGRNLAVLTSGPIPPNPSELLLTKHARQIILDIASKVDFTIIDTPPLLPVTDGAEIATIADATLVVHRAGKTTRDQAARAVEVLENVGKKPVGVILNMITRRGGKYDYQYGYYYMAYRPESNAKASKSRSEQGSGNEANELPTLPPPGAPVGGAPVGAVTPEPEQPKERGRRRLLRKDKTENYADDPVDPVAPLVPAQTMVKPTWEAGAAPVPPPPLETGQGAWFNVRPEDDQ